MNDEESKRIRVTFDKAELRSRLYTYTFTEARRHAGNLYGALVQELFENGCFTSAKYFAKFAEKEQELYSNTEIRDRVLDDPPLLMSIFDNCKMAETSALLEQCEGMKVTFSLLHQIMALLEKPQYVVKFNWLIKDINGVIVRMCDKLAPGQQNIDRPLAQIYLRHANCLMQYPESMGTALTYYEKSLALVQANKWFSININPETQQFTYVHESVVHSYTDAMLKFGSTIVANDYMQAIALGQKALGVLTQVGNKSKHLHHYVNAYLHMAEFYLEGDQCETALNLLNDMNDDLSKVSLEYIEKLKLRWFMDKGICHTRLNEHTQALDFLRQALAISQKLKIKSKEAEAYMHIGKLYSGTKQRHYAKIALAKSTNLFSDLKDMKSRKRNIFFKAQVINSILFPLFLDLMKKSDQDGDYFFLRRWKSQLQPFWHGQYLREDAMREYNGLSHLMQEFEVKKKVKDLLKI